MRLWWLLLVVLVAGAWYALAWLLLVAGSGRIRFM